MTTTTCWQSLYSQYWQPLPADTVSTATNDNHYLLTQALQPLLTTSTCWHSLYSHCWQPLPADTVCTATTDNLYLLTTAAVSYSYDLPALKLHPPSESPLSTTTTYSYYQLPLYTILHSCACSYYLQLYIAAILLQPLSAVTLQLLIITTIYNHYIIPLLTTKSHSYYLPLQSTIKVYIHSIQLLFTPTTYCQFLE